MSPQQGADQRGIPRSCLDTTLLQTSFPKLEKVKTEKNNENKCSLSGLTDSFDKKGHSLDFRQHDTD